MITTVDAVVQRHIEDVLHLPHGQISDCQGFVALGGSSIDAVTLSQRCRSSGVSLSVHDILKATCVTDMVKASTMCSDSGLHDHMTSKSVSNVTSTTQQYPMTEMQLMFAQASISRPGTNIIHHQQTCSPEQVPVLKHAWQVVLQGEPIFRSKFEIQNDDGYIVETDTALFDWSEVVAESEKDYTMILEERPPLADITSKFRVIYQGYKKPKAVACIVWSVHHALVDGFSMKILLDKVERVVRNQPIVSGPSFGKIASQVRHLQRKNIYDGQMFWKNQKDKNSTSCGELLLPPPVQPPVHPEYQSQSFTPEITTIQLQAYAASLGVTTASIYLAAWAIVLSQFTDADSVVFGVVFSGRDLILPGIAETVGPFVNTLPLSVTVAREYTTAAFVQTVFSQLLELSNYQWTTPEHGLTRQFVSAVSNQLATSMSQDCVGSASTQTARTSINTGIPLSIMIETDGTISLTHQTSHFSSSQASLLVQHYADAISFVCQPAYTVNMCCRELLSSTLRQRLLQIGNCNSEQTKEASVTKDLVSLFQDAVTAHPDARAVEHGDQCISYRELDRRSSCLAECLTSNYNIHEEEVICVHADQSINWIIAIYGILKSGGVYCPLAPNLTSDLRSSMFSSAGSRIFIVPTSTDFPLKPKSCKDLIAVQDIVSRAGDNMTGPRQPRPAAPAYVCFTSGSTGNPKGVVCSHRGLVAFQRDLEVRLFAGPTRKIAQLMSVSFDGSIHEIFSALSYGATLVLPDSVDPFSHLQRVDSTILTPSVAKVLRPEDFPCLRNVYLVGEPVPQDVNDRWASSKKLYNMYGPTEATCGATIKRLVPGNRVTIGHCNPSTRVYILNRHRELVPPGVIGQIYLAGVQVSYGYINRPDATREQFFEDSILSTLGERMYATGDFGYWNEAGEVVCLGRKDRQIKLRGFRLDLDDLETRILRIPEVTAAAVMRKDDFLVSFLQPASLAVDSIRAQMSSHLPPHAVPKIVVATENYPMTPAGKRDYKRMAKMLEDTGTMDPAFLTRYEKKIASVWSEILQLPGTELITPSSGFMELGGHSIHQLRLANRLSAMFDCEVSVRTLLEENTLQRLARAIEGMAGEKNKPTPHPDQQMLSKLENNYLTRLRSYQLSPIEVEWMSKYHMNRGTSAFNVSLAYQIANKKLLRPIINAWNMVLAHHEINRSRFHIRQAGHYRRSYFERPPQVQVVSNIDLMYEVNRPFQLEREHPIRVICSSDILLVVASHIVCDLTSMQLLLDEVTSLCNGGTTLPEDKPYMNSPVWLHRASNDNQLFWSTYLQGISSLNSPLLPQFNACRDGYHGTSSISTLPRDISRRMKTYTRDTNISPHQLCLGAVALALYPTLDGFDVVFGAPYLNRPSAVEMKTTGLFLEPLPIRIRSPDNDSSSSSTSFLQSIKKSSQAALAHAMPWTDLWQLFCGETDSPNNPLFDVMVTFHDPESSIRFPVQGTQPLYVWSQGSKFKLMFEFTAITDDAVVLRIEYDDALISSKDISQIETLLVISMGLLVEKADWNGVKTALRKSYQTEMNVPRGLDSTTVFGARMENLESMAC